MRLHHGLHLAYCTNIHRGEDWAQTFAALKEYTLAVRDRVAGGKPYAIGLRLSDRASRELLVPETMAGFRRWLDAENCYVFTINGFPFGRFHGGQVKEEVYRPDWTTPERLEYTNRLFEIVAELVPEGVEGSVSTLPGSFKEFITSDEQRSAIRDNLWKCVDRIAELVERTGKDLHLGLEPEPLGWFESTPETVAFFETMREERPNDTRLERLLGVNYDTCHLAVEFEEAGEAIGRLRDNGIRISKLHLSSALKVEAGEAVREALREFADDIYLHQVVARNRAGGLVRVKDLPQALSAPEALIETPDNEWRIHFHIPLHSPVTELFGNTADHLLGVMDLLKAEPTLCTHLEMETYTWEVLPAELKNRSVVDQLVGEYEWTLAELSKRGLGRG